jgi:hypothetical protein
MEELAESSEREVVREANIPGGRVRVFDDGSIELETAADKTWYRSFTELERSLRARDGLKSKQSDSADGNGGDTSAVSAPTATATDASPGQQATTTNIIS